MESPKELPIAITDFNDFISGNFIYVDKTDMIAKLLKRKGPYFLSRPRRFGKSTLLNTIHAYFKDGIKIFSHLKIGQCTDLPKEEPCRILHLDFTSIRDVMKSDGENFRSVFNKYLHDELENCGFIVTDHNRNRPRDILENALRDTNRVDTTKVVLLIDEYDSPLTKVIDNRREFKYRKLVLSNFFSGLKSNEKYFKFTFITGVSRMSQLSLFSEFNNLSDISFVKEYSALVGYTQDEIEYYFKDYINKAARVLNEEENTNIYTDKKILELLKKNYDGYCFDRKISNFIYNPWSILKFLEHPEEGFIGYWVKTGGAYPSLLIKYLKNLIEKEKDLSMIGVQENLILSEDVLSSCFEDVPSSLIDFQSILYQAGYYSIKRHFLDDMYELGVPNLEVKKAFNNVIMSVLLKQQTTDKFRAKYAVDFQQYLYQSNLEKLKDTLIRALNELSYESISRYTENMFRDLFKYTFSILGISVESEVLSALGRSDLCVFIGRKMYVIEIKVTDDESLADAKYKEACTQMINKKYALKLTDKEIIPLALVILNKKKTDNEEAKFDIPVLDYVR